MYMIAMIPYMILLTFLQTGINFEKRSYLPEKSYNKNWIDPQYYDSLREKQQINYASINKVKFNNEPIQLFLKYEEDDKTKKIIKTLCPSYTISDDWKLEINPFQIFNIRVGSGLTKDTIEVPIDCISKLYSISIDSTKLISNDFLFYQHPNQNEKGLLTFINIDNLSFGKHLLNIVVKTDLDDTGFFAIPFFKVENGIDNDHQPNKKN